MPARFVTNEVVTNRAGIVPFFHLVISICDIMCVTLCVCVCVCGARGGGGGTCGGACVPAHTRVRVLTMGAADAEIMSTQRFQALSLLRNDVHLEDFMHLISYCSYVSCYVSECLSIAVDAPISFSLGGVSLSVERSKVAGVRKDSLQKKFETLHGMNHHTQSQSTFTFCLIKLYQPFNQTILYLRDIHNTQSNHIFTRLYIYSHISHSSQSYRQQ